MAKLLNLHTNQLINLLPQHSFGRHASCHTILSNPKASRQHAIVSWDGISWVLQDISSNGTFVDNQKVGSEQEKVLQLDSQIQFATDDDIWQVQSLDAAKSILMPLSPGTALIELDRLTALPNESVPQITIYQDNQQQWICESESGTNILHSGATVAVDNQSWHFIAAQSCLKTLAEQPHLEPNTLHVFFKVSQNEEHVFINVKIGEELYDLGERNHHYLLLLLARQRQKDIQDNRSQSEQGWIFRDNLATMLGVDETHTNMLIYRLRKQFSKQLPENNPLINAIEKRRGSIRFCQDNIHISGGMSL